jgi:hypothetical protein
MPAKSVAQQRLFQAAEHGAMFPLAQKVRASMTHDQMHDFAVGSEAGKPMHVRKTPSVTRTAAAGTPLGPHFALHGFTRQPLTPFKGK